MKNGPYRTSSMPKNCQLNKHDLYEVVDMSACEHGTIGKFICRNCSYELKYEISQVQVL